MFYTRVVPAFEEVEVDERVSGEELSSVDSGPEVGVLESESVIASERQAPVHLNPTLSFTNIYYLYYGLLH
jgi:hypothetical protein